MLAGKGAYEGCRSTLRLLFPAGRSYIAAAPASAGPGGWLASSAAVLLLGTVCYEGIRLLVLRRQRSRETCRVVLHGADGRSMWIEGLVDTGNSLTEPISGRPVAVLEKRIWEQLYPEQPLPACG